MKRRGLLRLLGLAAAGLAGCSGGETERGSPPTRPPPATPTPEPPTPTPTPSPTPTPERFVDELQPSLDVTVSKADDGSTQVAVPVENTAAESRDATLSVTIEGSGQRYSAGRSVTVPGGTRAEYPVAFDVAWDTVAAEGTPIVREVLVYNPAYRSA